MEDSTSVLNRVALSYAPIINIDAQVIGIRLSIHELSSDAPPIRSADLISALEPYWPDNASPVALCIRSGPLLHDLLRSAPRWSCMVEIPASVALDPGQYEAIRGIYTNGNMLMLSGIPTDNLSTEMLSWFRYAVININEDRRPLDPIVPKGITRRLQFIQSGINSSKAMRDGFLRGAVAVLGWALDDQATVAASGQAPTKSDLSVALEMLRLLGDDASAEELAECLRQDPNLSFRLLRYSQSAVFEKSFSVSSFVDMINSVGIARLKNWIPTLLTHSSKGGHLAPAVFASVRRGILMETLGRTLQVLDGRACSELAMCGQFSLLDNITGQPMDAVLQGVNVPPRIRDALVPETGPFLPYLNVIRAVESDDPDRIMSAIEILGARPFDLNHALLTSLGQADAGAGAIIHQTDFV